jgi:hypothetical protein
VKAKHFMQAAGTSQRTWKIGWNPFRTRHARQLQLSTWSHKWTWNMAMTTTTIQVLAKPLTCCCVLKATHPLTKRQNLVNNTKLQTPGPQTRSLMLKQ